MSRAVATDHGELGPLVDAVQRNCDRADALHAREKSLCTYLLGMREYFRWAEQLPLEAAPERQRLSRFIAAREQAWDTLRERGDAQFEPLPLAAPLDPFDEAAANRELAAHNLVYGAGIGLFGAPLFFLAERADEQMRDGARVLIADRELARGVVAAPAASRAGTVLIRLDALRRWLWSRAEAAQRSGERTFAAALDAYGPEPSGAVERMARGEAETLVLHELGELRAGDLLGPEWEEMLAHLEDRRAELTLRALRDLLADCLITLPQLTARDARASLLFWFATFDGLRRALAPALAACCEAGRIDVAALEHAVGETRAQVQDLALRLRQQWRDGGAPAVVAATHTLAGQH